MAHDWCGDTRAGSFVRRSHDGACAVFHAVPGPDCNALHRTHFHLDMARASVAQCRFKPFVET
ncbi:extensin family protein [Paraburkholderia strydomiana]|uniref:extensin family protein n=1 Tax=Paraburkholderia strydomiana TaxID=1245417 RepID=UPI0038BC1584